MVEKRVSAYIVKTSKYPCTGESGGSTGPDIVLVSYLGYSFSSCTLAVSPKGPQ